MKHAIEIHELTTKAKIEQEEIKIRKAFKFVERELIPTIEALAKEGKRSILLQKPKKIKWKYVDSYLEHYNFTVINLFNCSLVIW